MRCGRSGVKRMADGGKRRLVWDARMGGKVPVGPKGIDTVPALTRGGPVMLDSQPGASEYVLTPDMVRALGGAKALDALRAKVHDFGRNARRRAAEGLADGGVPGLSDPWASLLESGGGLGGLAGLGQIAKRVAPALGSGAPSEAERKASQKAKLQAATSSLGYRNYDNLTGMQRERVAAEMSSPTPPRQGLVEDQGGLVARYMAPTPGATPPTTEEPVPTMADGGWLGGLFRGARGNRAQQIDRAVDAASAPAPKPAPVAPPAAEARITPSMADIMRDIRAKHPPIVGRADGGRLPLSGYADGGRMDEERPMLPPPDAYARAAKGSWLPAAARLLSGATVAERGLRGVGEAISNTGPAATMRGWREQQAAQRRAATLEGLKSRLPAGNRPGMNLDDVPAAASPRYAGGGAPQYDYTPPRQRAALSAVGGGRAAPVPEGQVAGFDRFPGGRLTAYADTRGNSLSFSSPRAGQDVPVAQYQAEARAANPRSGGVSASGIDAQAMGEANKNMREGRRGLGTFSDMRADTRSGGDYFGGVDVSQLSPEQYAQFKVRQMQADNDAQRELRLRKQASPYGEYGAQARATAAAQLQGLSAARAEQQAALSEYQRDVQMERVKGEVQKGVEREKAQAGTQREAPKETRAYLKQVMEGVDAGLEANQDLAAAMTGPGGAEKRGLLESLAGRLHSVFGAEANPSLIAGALQQAIPLLPSRAEAEAAARAELDSGIGGYFSEPSPEAVAAAADKLYQDAWTRVYQQVFGQLTGEPMAVGLSGAP